jgi:hypothetical protein
MKKSSRYITSLLMTSIYLLIVFTPLAPLAMQSKIVAHAVTGECSGDCTIDDCSLERSAAHTCCCWQKKKHGTVDAHLHLDADVCNAAPATVVAAPKKRASCCDAEAQEVPEKRAVTKSASTPAPHKTNPVTIGSTPCGNGTLFAFITSETTQHLPFFFTGDIPSPEYVPLTVITPNRLTSRYLDPPEPPPQNS